MLDFSVDLEILNKNFVFLFFIVTSIFQYKNNLLTQYFLNKNTQKLILSKNDFFSLPWYITKMTFIINPLSLIIYFIFTVFIFKFFINYAISFIILIIFLLISRVFKTYIKYVALVIYLCINVVKSEYFYLFQQVLSITTIFVSYFLCWNFDKRTHIKNYMSVNNKIYIIGLILLSYITEFLIHKIFNNHQRLLLENVLIFGSYLIFDYDCEVAIKLHHNQFFNMYKLAYVFNNKNIFTNWKKIKILKIVNLMIFCLIFGDMVLYKFDFYILITKIYLLLQATILFYFHLDVFIKKDILKNSIIYNNKFMLFIIKGWLYLPITISPILIAVFKHSIYIYLSFIIFWLIIYIIIYISYQSNWKKHEK